MGKHFIAVTTASFTLWFVASAVSGELKVQEDKENVVGSRLAGKWEPDDELTRRLGGRAVGSVRFTNDPTVPARIPAKFKEVLKDKPIYLAGTMTIGAKDYPYILIELRGNPHAVYFREHEGDPLADAESFNVMMAIAKETANDLLFLGGDFNNQPFAAFRRIKADSP